MKQGNTTIKLNIFYYHVYDRLKDQAAHGEMSIKEAKKYLGRVFHVPSNMGFIMLKELESAGFIKITDRFSFRIIEEDARIAANISQACKDLDFW